VGHASELAGEFSLYIKLGDIMKLTNKQFKEFKGYCDHYINLYGMGRFNVYYELKKLGAVYATCNMAGRTVTIALNAELDEFAAEHVDLRRTAKHEVIHMIIMDYDFTHDNAGVREADDYHEGLVVLLTKMMRD